MDTRPPASHAALSPHMIFLMFSVASQLHTTSVRSKSTHPTDSDISLVSFSQLSKMAKAAAPKAAVKKAAAKKVVNPLHPQQTRAPRSSHPYPISIKAARDCFDYILSSL